MIKDIKLIINQAVLVRDESEESANTARRVGGTIADLAEYVKNNDTVMESLQAEDNAIRNLIIAPLNISDIDFDRDKCTELIKLDTTTYYNVFTTLGGAVVSVGTMICFSDNLRHVLTQVLISHFPDPNGVLSHKDAEIYVHYRSYNYRYSTLDIPAYTWSAWKLLTSSEFNARFIGDASDSSADTDPFIVLGRFSKGESETTQDFYDRVNAAIDSTFSQDAVSENKKYCGDMRVFTGGVRTNIHQYVINYDAGKYVQVADGPIDVDANGKLLFSRNEYKVFSRLIEGGVAGSWTEFGRSPSILDIGTFANKDAACAYAARAEIAGNKQAALIIFHATGATGALLEGRIFQQVNGNSECMQILMWDKKLYRRNVTGASGVEGSGTNAFAWEETGAQKLQYDSAARKLTMKSYENGVIAEVTLPLADSSNAGLMQAGDRAIINNANALAESGAYYGVNRFKGFIAGVTLQVTASFKRLPVMYDRTLKTFVGQDINISGGTSTVKYYRTWLGSNIFNDTSTNKPHADHTYLCAGKMYEWNGTDLVELGIETQSNDNGTE